MQDADALIVRTRTHANEALLKGSKVQLVVTATIGHDHLDKEYLRKPASNGTTAQGAMQRVWRNMSAIVFGAPCWQVIFLPIPKTPAWVSLA